MNFIQEKFDIISETGDDNEAGICYGDFYYLNYYGINVFFRVCRTSLHQVRVIEIEKKRVHVIGEEEEKECIHYDIKPARHPLVITKENSMKKGERSELFWFFSNKEDKSISMFIDNTFPIYQLAQELGLDPVIGFVSAISLSDLQKDGVCNFYWDIIVDEKKKNKSKKDIDKIIYID